MLIHGRSSQTELFIHTLALARTLETQALRESRLPLQLPVLLEPEKEIALK
jgi:hypothetical protein